MDPRFSLGFLSWSTPMLVRAQRSSCHLGGHVTQRGLAPALQNALCSQPWAASPPTLYYSTERCLCASDFPTRFPRHRSSGGQRRFPTLIWSLNPIRPSIHAFGLHFLTWCFGLSLS